jgi:hypothetical protein
MFDTVALFTANANKKLCVVVHELRASALVGTGGKVGEVFFQFQSFPFVQFTFRKEFPQVQETQSLPALFINALHFHHSFLQLHQITSPQALSE